VDVLAPDLYLEYFDDVSARFTRDGNPLFIPETSANAANVMSAFGKFNAIAFSPFGIERSVGPDTELAAAYRVITQLAPAIAAQQGKGSITAVRMNRGDAPLNVKLGDYTLDLTYIGAGRVPIAPEATAAGQQRPQGGPPAVQAAAILIAAGPNEFYFGAGAGGLRIGFTANTQGADRGLGDVQEGKSWTANGRWCGSWAATIRDRARSCRCGPNTVLRVTVYRYE